MKPLDLGRPDVLGRLRPSLEAGLLEDRGHVGIGHEALIGGVVHIEHDPGAAVVVRVAKDLRTAASVLLPLLGSLCGEGLQEAVEVSDFDRGQNRRWPPFASTFSEPSLSAVPRPCGCRSDG